MATTAPLDAAGVNRLAMLAHDGLALTIRPAHTQYDGDTLFALSLPREGAQAVEPLLLGQAAVEVVAEAVMRAIRAATPLHGVPAAQRMSLTAAERAVIGNVDSWPTTSSSLTRTLVRIPTVNPPGDAYADCASLLSQT